MMNSELKPQDLRYGNLIEYKGKIFTVKAIEQYILTAVQVNDRREKIFTYAEVNPIPLTEEILLMAGLNKDYKKGYIGIDAANSDFVLTEPFKMGEWQNHYCFQFETGNVPKFKKLEFLHDLQNIFANFYNEELEINLK